MAEGEILCLFYFTYPALLYLMKESVGQCHLFISLQGIPQTRTLRGRGIDAPT